MTQVGDIITDPDFPTITLEMAKVVFEAIEPDALHGYERDHYEKAKAAFPMAGREHADQAWGAVITIADYLPFRELVKVHKRIGRDTPVERDANYAFTWGVYHERVEFCSVEGIDIVTGEPLTEDYEQPLGEPDELEAFNAMAVALSTEPAPMDDPDNWRRYRLHGRVWGRVIGLSPSEREKLKADVSASQASQGAKIVASRSIDAAYLPERFR